MQEEMHKAADQHDEMIQAIAEHDVEKVGQLVREHWDLSKRRLSEFVIPNSIDIPVEI